MNDCKEWLSCLLKDTGLCLCDDVRDAAKEMGFTRQELKDARSQLGVKTFHQFDEDGATGNWFWYLEAQYA